ncbi:MAG: cell wall hydrolase [Clostridiales bacterium]|nr:cell wall hydrolase [Clostridiales bacterium]
MKKLARIMKLGGILLLFLFFAAGPVTCQTAQEVQAATTTGFVTVNGKTYYYKNGSKVTGWLTLNGKKYYFNKSTGVMVTGWVKTSSGYRYFSKTDGHMFTGWVKTSSGYRYFSKSTGYMFTGWVKTSSGYRYFSKSTGYMYTGWVKNSSGKYRFFNRSTGYMYTGWMTTSSGKRYFNKSNGIMLTGWNSGKTRYFNTGGGIMYTGLKKIGSTYYYFNTSTGLKVTSTTITVSGVTYTVSSSGVCTVSTSSSSYTISGNNVKVYDSTRGKYYTLMKQYATHSGIADGTVTDLELLTALIDAEAGDQGVIGMEAVALTVLNRTLDSEFPSQLRYVIYQGTSFAQYSVVTNGALEKRLNGTYDNKSGATTAAKAAMAIYENYVNNGTTRTLSGFSGDFDYKYFMMESSFWAQSLDFSKVDYVIYGDHVFFVDWISA